MVLISIIRQTHIAAKKKAWQRVEVVKASLDLTGKYPNTNKDERVLLSLEREKRKAMADKESSSSWGYHLEK